jgi:hypothetical protein
MSFVITRQQNSFMMYLKISYQIWTNETVVKALKLISNIVVASFSDNVFKTRHHVIDKAFMDSLVHRRFPLFSSLNIQNLHQRLYCNTLKEHREINHANCRCHKQRLKLHMFRVDQQNQGKSDGTTQATVRHDKLIDFRQLVNSKFVCHEDEKYHTCEKDSRVSLTCGENSRVVINHSPITRKNEQKTIVSRMNQVFHV